MDKSQAEILLNKYNRGEASEMEMAILESWYLEQGFKSPLLNAEIDYQVKRERILARIQEQRAVHPKKVSLWPRVAVAASIALAISIGGYFYFYQSSKPRESAAYVNDVDPGKVGATLTLASGKQIRLADAGSGELAREAGVVITKTADGQVIYELKAASSGGDKLNTISTSRGETYRLRLPDGTSVWLNSASSLTYAADLNDRDHGGQRKVSLMGEAYFEVARDKIHPFIVESKGQQVEVLGTHFNVSAYRDEPVAKTTLLEGSVNINGTLLKPNQQALLSAVGIKIKEVDGEDAVAWKEGYFTYNGETLAEIMRQIARWYDVEVVFEDAGLKEKTFLGSIGRFERISKVLNMLSRTEVATFTIEGKTIKINKRNKQD